MKGPSMSGDLQPAAFSLATEYLDGYRVFTGADGDSEVEPLRIETRRIALWDTGKQLGLIDLPFSRSREVQIVFGPPDLDLPLHPAPYREMFVMLSGSCSLRTAKFDGELRPGSVVLFEDVDASVGHGGRTGPDGYVSVSIAP